MTSGHFTTLPLSSIYVDRADRQRRELTDIESLVISIRTLGLINPLVVERDGRLRAGERRLTAVRQLGWDRVAVQFVEDLDAAHLHLLELDENLRRVNLTWQEESKAIADYHALQQQLDPTWSAGQTAESLGLGERQTQVYLTVAKEIEEGNEAVAGAERISVARNIVARKRERQRSSSFAAITPVLPDFPLINADFHEWARDYEGEKFNLIHCDFPYGVGLDTSDQNAAANAERTYTDNEATYFDLLATLSDAMSTVVAESAHLIFWFSMKFFNDTVDRLEGMGWRVHPFPLIWLKSDNAGILPDAQRGYRQIYETALFASRGDRKIVRAVGNAIAAPTTRLIHVSEKPLNVVTHFLRALVDEYTIFLDPTCGSGTAVRAARALGAKSALGIERDPHFYQQAKEAFHAD